jgi:hypothetical protein
VTSGCYKPNLYTVTDGKKKSDWGRGSTELHFCENIIELSVNNALTSYDKTTFIFILRDSLPNKLDERGTCILPLVDTDGLIVGINLPGVSGFPKISISGSAFRVLLGNLYAGVGALAIFHLPNVPYNHKSRRSKDVDKKFILN